MEDALIISTTFIPTFGGPKTAAQSIPHGRYKKTNKLIDDDDDDDIIHPPCSTPRGFHSPIARPPIPHALSATITNEAPCPPKSRHGSHVKLQAPQQRARSACRPAFRPVAGATALVPGLQDLAFDPPTLALDAAPQIPRVPRGALQPARHPRASGRLLRRSACWLRQTESRRLERARGKAPWIRVSTGRQRRHDGSEPLPPLGFIPMPLIQQLPLSLTHT